MKILTIEQYEEMYESWCLNATCPELTQYTLPEWMEMYLQVIAPAGVDTFCESSIGDEIDLLLESDVINEGIFKSIKNVLKGRKLVKAKYKGFDNAARTYIAQSKSIGEKDVEQKVKDTKRQALKKSYDAAIKSIEDKVNKPLEDLKKESPVVSKYEKFAKLKYQLNLTKLHKKFGVGMANIKAYNGKVNDIKSEIANITNDIKAAEQEVKAKAGKAKDKKSEEPAKDDKVDNKTAKLESDIKAYNDAIEVERTRITKLEAELETAISDKKASTSPEKSDAKIQKLEKDIEDSKEDITGLKKKEQKAKDDLNKLGESKTYTLKSLNEFMNASQV